jgi:multiple sugar transport system permease protein
VIFLNFQLNNTLVGLTLMYTVITVPIGLWFLKGFFDAIPLELEQAALIDGCSRIGTLLRVTLPLAIPGVIATATWSFIIAWDEFVFAYTFISSEKLWPVSVGLSSHIGQYSINWSEIMAGAVLATLPIGILFIFFQRYLVSGITAGSVKG